MKKSQRKLHMKLDFSKMEGLGNDFVMLDDRDKRIKASIPYSDLARKLCDRHFGIGGDGIILARESQDHDIRFVIINSDGTEPEMCGNGMRCFAKYLYEKKILTQRSMRVETLAGTVIPEVVVEENNLVTSVKVDMGVPVLSCKEIPFVCDHETGIEESIETPLGTKIVTTVSMGNPHAVIFVPDIRGVDVEKIGVYLNDTLIAENGCRAESYTEELGVIAMAPEEIEIRIELNRGRSAATVWTSDFSYDYVRINAEYRT